MKSIYFKRHLFLAIAFFYFTTTQAQFTLRPYFGINSSTLTKDFQDAEWQSKLGYQAGVDAQIGGKIYVQPGLHWEMLNQSLRPTNPSIGDINNFRSTHIRIPLLIGVRLIDPEKSDLINIRMFTGPDAGFALGADGSTFSGVRFNKDALRSASFGYNLGIGLDFLFLFADAGYRWGLSRFFDQSSMDNGSRSNVFYFNVGIRFKI